jgi:hypothetical protein
MKPISFDILFEDPPGPCRSWSMPQRIDWTAVGETLSGQPERWARIAVLDDVTKAGRYANRIRSGLVDTLAPYGVFEAAARTVDGEHRVYARLVGEPR